MAIYDDQPVEKGHKERELCFIAAEVLEQSKTLLNSLPNENSFVKESTYVPKSNIAKHTRHLVDHYRLLFVNLPDNSNIHKGHSSWGVDYDSRDRNVPMETDKNVAIQEIEKLQFKILSTCIPLSTPVVVRAVIDSGSEEESEFQSNYGRELWFCIHHAIHHHALIKAICIEHGIDIPNSFGVAPSTQKYNQQS
ncbi:hypothetical protein K7432_010595 [Basidiobolus ranarum]|uniref:DinB-like domain-containing protein n=1 Tax=Basidiobolus ranarum TaxID=34480 RepID=A0ABR2VV93_9FUNG